MNRRALVGSVLLSAVALALGCTPATTPAASTTPATRASATESAESPAAGAAAAPENKFVRWARERGFVVRLPAGYHEVAVRENDDVAYDYAVTGDSGLEIRYVILPHEEPEVPEGFTEVHMADPDSVAQGMYVASVLNVAQGRENVAEPQELTSTVFGAKWVVRADLRIVEPSPESFAFGFKYCAAIGMYLPKVGQGLVFVLAKDLDALSTLDDDVLKTLTFAAR